VSTLRKTRNNDKDLLIELVKARFKLRYNNSILGFIWVLLRPLSYFMILYFVFTAIKGGQQDPNFAANLFLGIIIFTFFQEGVTFGMNSLLDMANILLKINFPRQIAILSSVLMATINLCVNFIVIIFITLVIQFKPHLIGVVYFAFIILIVFLMIYGISLFLSIIMVRVRDMTHIMDLTFQLLFYASAVFYTMDEMHGTTGDLIRLNPLAILIDSARKAFIQGQIVNLNTVLIIFAITLLLVFFGQIFFNKKIRRVAEYF
jgi:ABC-type polysaccharide/polyol phosphate export permease